MIERKLFDTFDFDDPDPAHHPVTDRERQYYQDQCCHLWVSRDGREAQCQKCDLPFSPSMRAGR